MTKRNSYHVVEVEKVKPPLRTLIDVDSKDNLYNPTLANMIDGTNLFGFKPKEATQQSDDSVSADNMESNLSPSGA